MDCIKLTIFIALTSIVYYNINSAFFNQESQTTLTNEQKTVLQDIGLIRKPLSTLPCNNSIHMENIIKRIRNSSYIYDSHDSSYINYSYCTDYGSYTPLQFSAFECNYRAYRSLLRVSNINALSSYSRTIPHLVSIGSAHADDNNMKNCRFIWDTVLNKYNIVYEDDCGNNALDYLLRDGRSIINRGNFYFENMRKQMLIQALTFINEKYPWDIIHLKQPKSCEYNFKIYDIARGLT